MKMYFNKGFRWRISGVLLLILTAFIIHSCKKESTKASPKETEKTDLDLIADAQSYFTKEVNVSQNGLAINSTGSSKTFRQLLDKEASFDNAYIQQEPIGKIVVIPLKFSKELYIDRTKGYIRLSDVSNLIIYTDSQKKKHAEIVTRIPDDVYLADTGRNKLFSGIVTVEDWRGNYIKGMQYSQGKIAKMLGAPETQNTKVAVNGVKKTNDFVCTTIDYYTVSYSTSSVKVKTNDVWVHYDYSETTCAIVWSDSGGGDPIDYSGIGGGTTGCPVPTGPLTPDPWQQGLKHVINAMGTGPVSGNCPPTQVSETSTTIIRNLVLDSCLKKMVDSTISANVQNQVNTLIQKVFGSSTKLNISFIDVDTLPNYVDGKTDVNGGMDSRGNLNVTILLNRNVMPAYSQQYIARVIMHEALHAYLEASGTLDRLQHEDMMKTYVTTMAASLQQMFSGLSDTDAKNLALGGLQISTAFQNTIATDLNLLGSFAATQLAYSVGSSGKRCLTK